MFAKSDYLILLAALLSFLLSVSLWFTGDRESGAFVGLWVPTILAVGIYVKVLARRAS